jgi:hypothetical protein
LATKLNADRALFVLAARLCCLLASESAFATPQAVVNKGRFSSRSRFCLHLFAFRAKR